MKLTEEQTCSVEHFEGPCMVLGTPGSGKTRVLTERVRYLVEQKNVPPNNILVITFTKAAAVQMKQRYMKMVQGSGSKVYFGTFHAVFFTILKYAYHYTGENIIKDEIKRQILKEFVAETEIEIQDENDFLNDLEAEISRVKGDMMDVRYYHSPNCPDDAFKKIFDKYQETLIRRRLIDFDDMLVYCYELLLQREDIRQMWQRQYPFILIDEFQDINKVQYSIIKLLAQPLNNLFVVGDDDQSIYSFRGAKPDLMQQFLKDFPDYKIYTLGVNYRCSGNIVKAASRLIGYNKNRLEKELRAENADGEAVEFKDFNRASEQNETIRAKILKYREEGVPYHEMAVLFRTNTQARGLTSKLMEFNIPFVMKERIPNIYEHWIAKDLLSYIQVAKGNRDRGVVMRIINRPKRYVHRNAFTDSFVDFEELKKIYGEKDWMMDKLEQFERDLEMLAGLKPYAAINFIRCGIGYDEYIKEYADYRGIRPDDMLDMLEEIQEEAKGYPDFDSWFEYIREYSEELKEQAGKSRELMNGDEPQDAVMVMTMHGAKGLEYECVFIPDANEGVTPHHKAVLDADMEEERRMFYVAMTRAKKHLHIYFVKERFNKEAEVSRFVEEITGEIYRKADYRSPKAKKSLRYEKNNSRNNTSKNDLTTANVVNSQKYRFGETSMRYKKPQGTVHTQG